MDKEGKLTDDELAKARFWLQQKASPARCVFCGASSFIVEPNLVRISLYRPDRVQLGGPSYLNLPVICSNCGHTNFFNAFIMGLLPKPSKTNAEPAAKEEKSNVGN